MNAQDYITMYDRAERDAVNFRSLYQSVADLMFPRENKIISTRVAGEEKGSGVIDPTGIMASIEMASGLSINLFPPGQRFYNVVMADKALNEIDSVKRVLGKITDISHQKRANSNFMLQANETLRSISVFGTGCLFNEWVPGIGLNYIDYDVGQYLIRENSKGRVDTVMFKIPYTVTQAIEEYGDRAGESVMEMYKDPSRHNEQFWYIRVVRPRAVPSRFEMPFEVTDISIKDKVIVYEGGYEEFPYAVPRWTKSSGEVWGRGQGTFALSAVRGLQTLKRDLYECGNKHNNPPLEVLESFEGEVKTFPGALNFVAERKSIGAIEQQALGNFPITVDILENAQEEVKKWFFNDVFVQLRDLKGDRRTTLEIRERLAEGLQRLGPPIGRLQEEWLSPLVARDILLLLRNGELPPLPPEMHGKAFKIEYVGRLAMELKSQQARGWQQWAATGAELSQVFPDVIDNINVDSGYRRLGETLGVSVEDMTSADERDQLRQQRAAQQQAMMQTQLAAEAGKAYPGATKAPEEGSAAKKIMDAVGV